MVTVSYTGGPGTDFNIFSALRAWLTPDDAVVPASEIYSLRPDAAAGRPAGHPADAGLAAGRHRGRAVLPEHQLQDRDTIAATAKGTPAYGVLQPGRRDHRGRRHAGRLPSRRRHHDPGPQAGRAGHADHRPQGVDQDDHAGRPRTSAGQPVVGVQLASPRYVFPFTVKINLPDIGGPSAGMMFALGIIDKLTPQQSDRRQLHRRDRRDRARPARSSRSAASSRRWPAPGPRRHDLPDPGRQLRGHRRRRARRAAAGEGQLAGRRDQRSAGDQAGQAGPVVLTPPAQRLAPAVNWPPGVRPEQLAGRGLNSGRP